MGNQKITTFLMFSGQAQEAMNFYTSIFDESEIKDVTYHEDGTVLHAIFVLKGQTFMCIDSKEEHDFTFTPAISLLIDCDTSEEIDELFKELSQEGHILMPLSPAPFSVKFAWIVDKFGVSWQLSLL